MVKKGDKVTLFNKGDKQDATVVEVIDKNTLHLKPAHSGRLDYVGDSKESLVYWESAKSKPKKETKQKEQEAKVEELEQKIQEAEAKLEAKLDKLQ